MDSAVPVSYTHLDVYKRQFLRTIPYNYYALLTIVMSPVSYTHLDVYKRQPVLGVINGTLLSGQKLLKIKRNQGVHFTKGSNWFSCTDGFARYLLTKEEWILQVLDKTFCSDEFFVQTLIAQSPYQDKICLLYTSRCV